MSQLVTAGAMMTCTFGVAPSVLSVLPTSKTMATTPAANISVPEYPGRKFPATVEASAQAVDVGSGTTRMLLIVDNASGELMTGAFAYVRFEIPAPDSAINVPASALIFDQSGLRVATIDSNNRVVLKPVTISRDLGSLLEIGSGLSTNDRVVANPPDGIASGDEVRIAGEPEIKGAPDSAPVKRQPRG
jgi:multidrug efflux pump subunit AcrA (membrane-fusion protein)